MNEFSNLQRIWFHSNISIQRKILLFNSLIISKLLYGLDSTQLNESEKRRLDAFHAKCLRRILKVPHSFYNHVSNSQIWKASHTQPLTSILVRRQLKLFGQIALMPSSHDLRSMVFNCNSFTKPIAGPRRRGRPRNCWLDELHAIAIRVAGSDSELAHVFNQWSSSLKLWLDAVDSYLSPSDLHWLSSFSLQ